MERLGNWADGHQGLVPALVLANLVLTALVIAALALILLVPGSVLGDSLRGEPGERGPVGVTGPPGERGPAGPAAFADPRFDQALSDVDDLYSQLDAVAVIAREADAKALSACQTAMDVGYQTGSQPFIC